MSVTLNLTTNSTSMIAPLYISYIDAIMGAFKWKGASDQSTYAPSIKTLIELERSKVEHSYWE